MKAILHLGTEKTGTSTIQRFLKKNREALVEQGFYFMKSTGEADDRKLSAYCLLEEQFDDFHRNNLIDTKVKKKEFEKKLEKDIEGEIETLPDNVHTIIFSSEHFHSRVRDEEQREKLKNILSRHFDNFDLISYIRPQVDVAASHYSTYLKGHGVGELSKYLEQCNSNNYYYDYLSYLIGWEEGFPSSNLGVRIFDKKELVNGDVIADFCQSVGLDGSCLEDIDSANESVTPTGQEMLKVINKNFDAFIQGKGLNPARGALVQIISRIFPGAGQKPTAEQAYAIQLQFDNINEKVRQRWFPERDSLFDVRYEKFDQQEPIDWRVVEFFELFIKEYSKLNNAQLAGIPPRFIDELRDIALDMEERDISSSFALMQLASLLRPHGPFISKKVKEYEALM